jgi:hypothetical protein
MVSVHPVCSFRLDREYLHMHNTFISPFGIFVAQSQYQVLSSCRSKMRLGFRKRQRLRQPYKTCWHPPGSGIPASHNPRNGATPPGPVGLRTHTSKYSNSVAKIHCSSVTFAQIAFHSFLRSRPSVHPVILKWSKRYSSNVDRIRSCRFQPASLKSKIWIHLRVFAQTRNTRKWDLIIAVRCIWQ